MVEQGIWKHKLASSAPILMFYPQVQGKEGSIHTSFFFVL